jgi:hypothetical protein
VLHEFLQHPLLYLIAGAAGIVTLLDQCGKILDKIASLTRKMRRIRDEWSTPTKPKRAA